MESQGTPTPHTHLDTIVDNFTHGSLQQGILSTPLTTHSNRSQVYRAAAQVLKSSFCRVAPELWAEIFLYYLPAFEPTSRDSFLEYEQHLLVLSSVCGHWHAVALSTPRLWSRIEYSSSPSHGSARKSRLPERVGAWISRSRNCPLTIMLTLHPGADSDLVLGSLVLQSRRWEFLHVSADCERRVCKGLSPIISGNLPLLRQAHVNVPLFGNEINPSLNLVWSLKQAPRLTSVHLSRIDPSSLHLLFDLPLTQLKSLTLPSITSSRAFFCVLSQLPSVEDLRVTMDVGPPALRSRSEVPELPFIHTNLRSFSLDIAVRGDDLIIRHLQHETSHILANVDLPHLSTFSIACGETHWPLEEAMSSFLKRNGRLLRELKVTQKQEKVARSTRADLSAQLREVLLLVPRLRGLELKLAHKSLVRVLGMVSSRGGASLVPLAEKLNLTILEDSGCSAEDVIEAISHIGQSKGLAMERTSPQTFILSTHNH
ncbi:hypothetical protein AAF712_013392 [Marasmius tenuissimus]|uniref:F-box domain-containing protein n=1 Tax=Marasmius tenuissimus TaxID=585030 RepID=A0ABR2ZDV0_9AGAR